MGREMPAKPAPKVTSSPSPTERAPASGATVLPAERVRLPGTIGWVEVAIRPKIRPQASFTTTCSTTGCEPEGMARLKRPSAPVRDCASTRPLAGSMASTVCAPGRVLAIARESSGFRGMLLVKGVLWVKGVPLVKAGGSTTWPSMWPSPLGGVAIG
ncbi:hypothetical protein D3C86_1670210 [compost metagenome]